MCSPDSEVHITITDEISGTRLFEGYMDAESFAQALFARAYTRFKEAEAFTKYTGMKCEHKTEIVPFVSKDYKNRKLEAAAALKPFEIDGWMGYVNDIGNHHLGSEKTGYRVKFHRYVPNPDPIE
jgi:hypothetical protein